MKKTTTNIDDEPLTAEEAAEGFYSFGDMVLLGFVKDRQDQHGSN